MDIFSIDLDFIKLAFDEKQQIWTMGYSWYFCVSDSKEGNTYYNCSFDVLIHSNGEVKDLILFSEDDEIIPSEYFEHSLAVQERIWASQEMIKTIEAFKKGDWKEHFDHSRSRLNGLLISLFLDHALFSMRIYITPTGDIESFYFYHIMDSTKKRYSTAYLFDGFDDFLSEEKINDIQDFIKEKNRLRYLMKK